MRRFELVEGTSSKFWEIELEGAGFTVRFGRIGTAGQTQQKSFATPEKARAEHDKLVAEKVKKGYAEVGATAGTQVAPAPAPVPKKTAAKPAAKVPKAEPEASPEPEIAASPATEASLARRAGGAGARRRTRASSAGWRSRSAPARWRGWTWTRASSPAPWRSRPSSCSGAWSPRPPSPSPSPSWCAIWRGCGLEPERGRYFPSSFRASTRSSVEKPWSKRP